MTNKKYLINELNREIKAQLSRYKKDKKAWRVKTVEAFEYAIKSIQDGDDFDTKYLPALKRELTFRQKFYPIWINQKRLNQNLAKNRIKMWQEIITQLTPPDTQEPDTQLNLF